MLKRSRFAGLFLALWGSLALWNNLSNKPRVAALHGSDIVGLIGCGMCFGVGLVGLIGGLRVGPIKRGESDSVQTKTSTNHP
jgi:hypothetical protein